MHVHAAPDLVPRRQNDLELAREAREHGMGGLLLKSHSGSTVERAWLVQQVVGRDFHIYGGLCLNDTVGGLNPSAVETAIRLGAKEIWFPTQSALHHRSFFGDSQGITVFDERGRLRAEVLDILQLVARAGIILGTGHLSPQEILAVAREARRVGVEKILVTHPETQLTWLDTDFQRLLMEEAHVFFERCLFSTTPAGGGVELLKIAYNIRTIGVESTVLATDFGQPENPPPVQAMEMYLRSLEKTGLSLQDLERMAVRNPRELLSLS